MRCVLVASILAVACNSDPPKAAPPPAPPPVPVDPYADVRVAMVRDTIAARGIQDEHVLAAMRKVPRHAFVPPEIRSRAYDDSALPIGFGLTISQPYIVAAMTEAAHVHAENRVLEIGTGSGYQAAVLAAMGCDVYTIEINADLAKRTELVFQQQGLRTIKRRTGDGYFGWSEAAPFDAILVTAAAPEVPKPLLDQLKVGGHLVIPLGTDEQVLTVVTKASDGTTREPLLDVLFGPMLGAIRDRR